MTHAGTNTATRTVTRTWTSTQTRSVTPTGGNTATRTPTRTQTSTPPAGCNLANLPPPAATPNATVPVHRIGVRAIQGVGEFYDVADGTRFTPRGFDYVRLQTQVGCYSPSLKYHSTFNTDTYDATRIESALEEMQASGYNTVRVFLNSCCANGIGDSSGGLSAVYITHLADFIQRAKANHIRVVLTIDSLPELGGYVAFASQNSSAQIQGANRTFLAPNFILAQRRFWQDLITALRQHNAPLDAIMTYEIKNEAYFDGRVAPFSLTSGTFTPANGKTYDLAIAANRIEMANESLVYWVTQVRGAILQMDPTALVTVGFFGTPLSDGTTFPAQYLPPTVMLENVSAGGAPIDWADVHLYPNNLGMSAFAHYLGFDVPRAKPVALGELGFSKSAYGPANYAADGAQAWQTQSCGVYVSGCLVWTFDTTEQTGIWNAEAANGLLKAVMSPQLRPDPCAPWSVVGVNIALNRPVTASSNSSAAPKAVDGAPLSVWSANANAPQWIEINLGTPQQVNQIRMVTQQTASGNAVHRVWRITPNAAPELLYEFNGTTANGQVIDYTPSVPWANVQTLRIETVTNPSPVTWREIEVFSR